MNPTDLVRELLEVLREREWVYGRFGDAAECTDCFAGEHERSHREGCRYVATVKAAREFLARDALTFVQTEPSGSMTIADGTTIHLQWDKCQHAFVGRFDGTPVADTPMGQLADAIRRRFPGLPVYPIDMTAHVDGPQVTLAMPNGRAVTIPASESKEFMRQTMLHYREAFTNDAPGVVGREDAH